MNKSRIGAALILLSLAIVGVYMGFFNNGVVIYKDIVVATSLGLLLPACILMAMGDNERLKKRGKSVSTDDMNS